MKNSTRLLSGVGAVTINYRAPDFCLNLVRQLQQDGQIDFVAIINNGSSHRICASNMVGINMKVMICDLPQNVGFASAANTGIRQCLDNGAEAVFLLNPDLKVFPSAIGAMIRRLSSEEGLLIVTPREPPGRIGTILGEPIPMSAAYAWLIPKETVERVGLFDTDFFFGREDTDYCVRLWLRRGRIVREQGARIIHLLEQGMPPTATSLQIRAYHMMRGRMLLMRKHSIGRVGVRFQLSQVIGIVRDFVAMAVKYRSPMYFIWQFRGIRSGSIWPRDDAYFAPA